MAGGKDGFRRYAAVDFLTTRPLRPPRIQSRRGSWNTARRAPPRRRLSSSAVPRNAESALPSRAICLLLRGSPPKTTYIPTYLPITYNSCLGLGYAIAKSFAAHTICRTGRRGSLGLTSFPRKQPSRMAEWPNGFFKITRVSNERVRGLEETTRLRNVRPAGKEEKKKLL